MAAETTEIRVPFLDLSAIHGDLKAELLESFSILIDSGAFINGPAVRDFEQAFAAYVGTSSAIGLASGLDALRLGLLAMGLQPGDEVIVPANTFVATLEAVTQAGGHPVPVEMSEADWNIDAQAAEAAIGEKTRFLMPVHLYGQMADMRALVDLAERSGVVLAEDACQAHGAERDGIRAGVGGTFSAFSFYPGKNLGAFGDAGALTTNDVELAEAAKSLREHGQRAKYEHEREGWTARLDTIQAIVLLAKLSRLDGWNDERGQIAANYLNRLDGVGDLELPPVAENSSPVWHLFVVRTADPAALADYLRSRGIATGRHYPDAVHLTEAYRWLGYEPGSFPIAERHAERVLSLPIFPGMSIDDAEAVVSAVSAFFDGG
ncbi:MAG TPA: DegT/DnrJ/EryC1/StrS family aminotransferase [Gaiellaceae bacterium]|nr:DegT/DnrJ/EryC1/StrS family aminotransferase [Gaiellaceae bacterium]